MKYQKIFSVEDLPVFQNKMFRDRTEALLCPKGDVTLVRDLDTGLIFNGSFNDKLLQYDADYQNEQAYSVVFQKHLEEIKTIMGIHFWGKPLLEVGCGKGYFLESLHQSGYDVTGIDPAYEGENGRVIKACFTADLGLSADGIVLRHVLEHAPDPLSFLFEISQANNNKGIIYIEVPCLDWICRRRAWFDVYYEHVNYFRVDDFTRIFGRIYDSGHVFGGQYLYVIADLATLRKPVFNQNDSFAFPSDFLLAINQMADMAKGKRNLIWGGASKGVIFALYMQRSGVNIDLVVDINPAKQGKFLAGSGLKVSSPEEGVQTMHVGDNVFVMNSNYLEEIIESTSNKFNYIQVDHHEF